MVRRPPYHIAVAGQLREAIARGELERGAQIPTERELGERYGVSRTAVREGIKSLQAEGLLSVVHGRGTFVVSDGPDLLSRPLATLVAMGDVSISELTAVRRLIEPPLASYAALHRTDAEAQELTDILAQTRLVSDPDQYEALDAEFHLAIARVSRNRLADQLMGSLRSILATTIEDMLRSRSWLGSTVDEQHFWIAEAIERRDSSRAYDAMHEHLRISEERMLELATAVEDAVASDDQ